MRSTITNEKFWKERKIDWVQSYLSLWNHPHRHDIARTLAGLKWNSLLEVGCASGPNLLHLVNKFPGKDIGGIDVNPDAIAVAKKVLEAHKDKMPSHFVFAEVMNGDAIFIGDKATDVILTDMTLIYVDPQSIKRYLKEFRRVARGHVVFYEFYSPKWWERWNLSRKGYWTHNYPKLLKKLGYDDIIIKKLPPTSWPESEVHQKFGYIIQATIYI